MDALDMHGALAGAGALTVSYAHAPLAPTVNDEAFAELGASVTYERFRFSLDLASPLAVQGGAPDSPNVDLAHDPDVVWDPRFGFDVRFFGDATSPLRLGWSARVFVPNGDPVTYQTDGALRGMFLLAIAGDLPHFTYAAHAGVHVREGDLGDEFLFGAAAGARVGGREWSAVLGAEVFGAAALGDFSGSHGVEALLSTRLEHPLGPALGMRLKLGGGGGLDPHFGTPEWRLVAGVELFGAGASR